MYRSSDSSSDDDQSRLEAAIDPQFDPNAKQSSKSAKSENRSRKVNKNDRSELDVTPGFQMFVAKRLSESLDKSLKYVNVQPTSIPRKKSHKGIKLFMSSKTRCTLSEKKESVEKRPLKKECSSSSEDDERTKLSECAVTSDWVLNGAKSKYLNRCDVWGSSFTTTQETTLRP